MLKLNAKKSVFLKHVLMLFIKNSSSQQEGPGFNVSTGGGIFVWRLSALSVLVWVSSSRLKPHTIG